MGKRARRTANAVSLFPFLAVLICAMGALILLLLVTTRRIRKQQAQQTVAAAVTPAVPAAPAEPAPREPSEPAALPMSAAPPTLSPPPSPTVSPAVSPTVAPKEPDVRDIPLLPLFALDPLPPIIDPNDEWRARLEALKAEQTQLAAAVNGQKSAVEQIRTSASADSLKLKELKQEAAAFDEEKSELEESFHLLQDQEFETEERSRFLRRKIDETREQLARADSQFTIMPFDGRLGTTRRPIIIECTENAITFVSEGVSLSSRDLNGFPSRYNPLLYASRALSKYWARKDRTDNDAQTTGDPYVLLVVRPQGTVAYYVARKLLGRSHDTFGYELVRDDQEFVWPASDPTATRLCRDIVDRMLSERDSLYATSSGATQQRVGVFSDAHGAFRLEEIDRVRDPGRSVTINGQRYNREPLAATATNPDWSGHRQQDSAQRRGSTQRRIPSQQEPPGGSMFDQQATPGRFPGAEAGGAGLLASDTGRLARTSDPRRTGSRRSSQSPGIFGPFDTDSEDASLTGVEEPEDASGTGGFGSSDAEAEKSHEAGSSGSRTGGDGQSFPDYDESNEPNAFPARLRPAQQRPSTATNGRHRHRGPAAPRTGSLSGSPGNGSPARSPFAEFARTSRFGASDSHGSTGSSGAPGSPGASGSSGTSGSSSVSGSSGGQNARPMLDLSPVTRRDAPAGAEGENPQWGIFRPGGLIGFEREVPIHVTATQVTIADETLFPVAADVPTGELRDLLATHLNHQVRSWGKPPRSFYWLPAVNFTVAPGGDQSYGRLKTVVERWKLRSTTKYVPE